MPEQRRFIEAFCTSFGDHTAHNFMIAVLYNTVAVKVFGKLNIGSSAGLHRLYQIYRQLDIHLANGRIRVKVAVFNQLRQ